MCVTRSLLRVFIVSLHTETTRDRGAKPVNHDQNKHVVKKRTLFKQKEQNFFFLIFLKANLVSSSN